MKNNNMVKYDRNLYSTLCKCVHTLPSNVFKHHDVIHQEYAFAGE